MIPSSASISRTKCPFPIPPMEGLQLNSPSVDLSCVIRRVRAPVRADAHAASVPACPPPMTITSYDDEDEDDDDDARTTTEETALLPILLHPSSDDEEDYHDASPPR